MSNFISLSAINCPHVCAVLEWCAKSDSPISEEEFDIEASSRGWAGANGAQDHREFNTQLWGFLTNKT